jgi:hypothetical protein
MMALTGRAEAVETDIDDRVTLNGKGRVWTGRRDRDERI